jgi:hypothetical protein
MYVMYYASMHWCWQLIKILVRTNHPCLRVGCHIHKRIVANCSSFHLRVFLGLSNPQRQRDEILESGMIYIDNNLSAHKI